VRKILKIIHVVGARPNFIKTAGILRACKKTSKIESLLVHTGLALFTEAGRRKVAEQLLIALAKMANDI
jgi:UDP-N-acetylglucosamine 2-epimerase